DCMGKDLEIGVCRAPEMQIETNPSEQHCSKQTDTTVDKLSAKDPKNEGFLSTLRSNLCDDSSAQAANLTGVIANSSDTQVATGAIQTPSGFSKISEDQDKINYTSKDLLSLELSLKRLRSIGKSGTATQDDRNVVRRANGIAEQNCPGSGNGSGSGSGSGIDQNRLAQREAALKKFRQKRKERNYGKKVALSLL
ncbi:hypothetical protein GW17_00040551, partial [Ensete ventricosum]